MLRYSTILTNPSWGWMSVQVAPPLGRQMSLAQDVGAVGKGKQATQAARSGKVWLCWTRVSPSFFPDLNFCNWTMTFVSAGGECTTVSCSLGEYFATSTPRNQPAAWFAPPALSYLHHTSFLICTTWTFLFAPPTLSYLHHPYFPTEAEKSCQGWQPGATQCSKMSATADLMDHAILPENL